MKTLFNLIIFILIQSQVFAGGVLFMTSNSTQGGQSPNLLFKWEDPTSTTVDYSAGDSTGTANGTVQIASNAVDTNDTGGDGADFYAFDVSSNDIVDAGGTGTVFIRYYQEAANNSNSSIWAVDIDFNDYILIHPQENNIRVVYYSAGQKTCATTGSPTANGNWYWARVAWQNSTPYMTIEVYSDSAGSIGSSLEIATNSTDNWTVGTAATSDDFQVGNTKSVTVDAQISYIAVYDDVRTTE
jgi:hypothetical protein